MEAGDYRKIPGKFRQNLLTSSCSDPPYNKGLLDECFRLIAENELLAEDGVIVAEHRREEKMPEELHGFQKLKRTQIRDRHAFHLCKWLNPAYNHAIILISISRRIRHENKGSLYTGSFDPLTNGHYNIIENGLPSFMTSLRWGSLTNPAKKKSLFSLQERKEMIEETMKPLGNVRVDSFSGLLADYVNKNGFNVVVRGLRSSMDFEYEIQMAQMNARLFNEAVETVFRIDGSPTSFYQFQHGEGSPFTWRQYRRAGSG